MSEKTGSKILRSAVYLHSFHKIKISGKDFKTTITFAKVGILFSSRCHLSSGLKRPSHGKLKLANLWWQTQVGVCERH